MSSAVDEEAVVALVIEGEEAGSEVILKGGGKPLASVDALCDACLPALTASLWQTCCWPDAHTNHWTIGDFRFLVLEFQPSRTACLYIQFWSEPDESVLMEVSSGNWNAGALKYIRREQRTALEALGFEVG